MFVRTMALFRYFINVLLPLKRPRYLAAILWLSLVYFSGGRL